MTRLGEGRQDTISLPSRRIKGPSFLPDLPVLTHTNSRSKPLNIPRVLTGHISSKPHISSSHIRRRPYPVHSFKPEATASASSNFTSLVSPSRGKSRTNSQPALGHRKRGHQRKSQTPGTLSAIKDVINIAVAIYGASHAVHEVSRPASEKRPRTKSNGNAPPPHPLRRGGTSQSRPPISQHDSILDWLENVSHPRGDANRRASDEWEISQRGTSSSRSNTSGDYRKVPSRRPHDFERRVRPVPGYHPAPEIIEQPNDISSTGDSYLTPTTVNLLALEEPIDVYSNNVSLYPYMSEGDYGYFLPSQAMRTWHDESTTSSPRFDSRYSDDVALARTFQEVEVDRIQEQPATKEGTCVVCGDTAPIASFPSLVYCTHPSETCSDCFAEWIASQLQANSWREVKCPGSDCRRTMLYPEIKQYAKKEIFEQYDNFTARAVISEDPHFRWCQAAGCGSGQIHDSGAEGNIFRCVACGHKVCILHEVAWHAGETCAEYDERVSGGRRRREKRKEEEASIKAIRQFTKKCPGPGCVYSIEKNRGCDHMTCSRCGYEFCWICLCDYHEIRRRGNAAHGAGCKYHADRIE